MDDLSKLTVDKLIPLGWKNTYRGNTTHFTDLFYANKIGVELFVAEQDDRKTIALVIVVGNLQVEERFFIRCWEKIDQILDIIISFQNKINEENYIEYVESLLNICPLLLNKQKLEYFR